MVYINGRFLNQKRTGVQRFAFELITRLCSMHGDIKVIAPFRYRELRLDLVNIPMEFTGKHEGHLWEQTDLPKYLKHIGSPPLLNLCNTGPLFYTNQIVTIHDIAFLRGNWHSLLFRTVYRFYIPRLIASARHLITVSEFSKSEIAQTYNLSSKDISVIYNAPLILNNSDGLNDGASLRDETVPYVLAVGSLDPRKNLKTLIRAFLRIKKETGLKLYLVGGYNPNFAKDNELQHLLDKNKDAILFLGYVSDDELVSLYKRAVCFVFPSIYEGFGLPPLEAMANGCPTIVSNVASLPEVCGDASLYIDPKSDHGISIAITEIYKNEKLRFSLINKGHLQATKFSWDRSATLLSDLLSSFR